LDARRAALIVAGYEYQDPGLRRLRAPAQDAEALARVLSDPKIGDFDVRTLLNEPESVIREAVEEFFTDRSPDDLLLLHFSCHGVKDEGGELYFATTNTKLRLLGATAVAAEFVNRCMNRSRSRRVILLLDCCYAGAFERGMLARADKAVDIKERFGGRGRAVITASSAMEYAFEGDELSDTNEHRPSLFTSALVEGLDTGEADRDQDGYVGLDELYDYVYDRVRAATPNQTPGKWTFGVQGDLYIARNSRPVTKPAPLPQELQPKTPPDVVDRHAAPQARDERRLRIQTGLAVVGAGLLFVALFLPWGSTVLFVLEAIGLSYGRSMVATVALGGTLLAFLLVAVSLRRAGPTSGAEHAVPAEPDGRGLRIPAGLAIAGAVLLVVALFLPWAGSLSGSAQSVLLPAVVGYTVTVAALVAGAGGCMLVYRTNWLIGPGVLLGTVAASTWGMLLAPLILLPTNQTNGGSVGAGVWFLAHVILLLAAGLAGLSLARAGAVRIVLRLPMTALPWFVVLLGVVGAIAFFVAQELELNDAASLLGVESRSLLASLWPVAMALLVPVLSVLAEPRRFGIALLVGWVGGGASLFIFEFIGFSGNMGSAIIAFGATLLALLLVAAPFGRAVPNSPGQHAGRT
jgi:hypothetical protein